MITSFTAATNKREKIRSGAARLMIAPRFFYRSATRSGDWRLLFGHSDFYNKPVTIKIMPIYEYKCADCGAQIEKMQKISDAPLTVCEVCGGKLEKQWSLSGFQFKGAGWYVTDYSDKSKTNSGKSEKTEKAEKSDKSSDTEKKSAGESTGDGESASKPSSDTKETAAPSATVKKD